MFINLTVKSFLPATLQKVLILFSKRMSLSVYQRKATIKQSQSGIHQMMILSYSKIFYGMSFFPLENICIKHTQFGRKNVWKKMYYCLWGGREGFWYCFPDFYLWILLSITVIEISTLTWFYHDWLLPCKYT